jgi:hypothetical protein
MQEMPEVPDVAILHCGELPHHKMGIRVREAIQAFHWAFQVTIKLIVIFLTHFIKKTWLLTCIHKTSSAFQLVRLFAG